jgi:hypothetical protein
MPRLFEVGYEGPVRDHAELKTGEAMQQLAHIIEQSMALGATDEYDIVADIAENWLAAR